jgi:hypothetical protein
MIGNNILEHNLSVHLRTAKATNRQTGRLFLRNTWMNGHYGT